MADTSKKIRFALYESYMARILGSVGSDIFKNNFAFVDNVLTNITREGELSCASHVSGILVMSGLLKEMHTRTAGTIPDMIESGWYEITESIPGAVIVWPEKETKTGKYPHIGFCLNNGRAISNLDNSYTDAKFPGCPNEHSIDFDGMRKIEKIFWHDKLGKPEERKES